MYISPVDRECGQFFLSIICELQMSVNCPNNLWRLLDTKFRSRICFTLYTLSILSMLICCIYKTLPHSSMSTLTGEGAPKGAFQCVIVSSEHH